MDQLIRLVPNVLVCAKCSKTKKFISWMKQLGQSISLTFKARYSISHFIITDIGIAFAFPSHLHCSYT